MGTASWDNLGIVWSPVHLAVAAFLVIAMLSPRLLPQVGRMLGRILNAELRRRIGLPPRVPPRRAPQRPHTPAVEVLPPERMRPAMRAPDPTPVAPARLERRQSVPTWAVAAIAAGAVAVLLWFLLHSR